MNGHEPVPGELDDLGGGDNVVEARAACPQVIGHPGVAGGLHKFRPIIPFQRVSAHPVDLFYPQPGGLADQALDLAGAQMLPALHVAGVAIGTVTGALGGAFDLQAVRVSLLEERGLLSPLL